MKPTDINLRSEEVQEILGRPPRRIVRYGITLIFIIVAGLFIGSYFFKYPEILKATITVTTENVPADLTAKVSGRIDSLFVREKKPVKQGDIIAVIENPARYEDVLAVKQSLQHFVFSDTSFYTPVKGDLMLADIQQSYTAFVKACEDYRYFVNAHYHEKMIGVFQQELQVQNHILQKTQRQLSLAGEQMTSARNIYKIDSNLLEKKVLSRSDFESSKSSYLQQQQSYESSKLSLDNLNITILQLKQSIYELEQQRAEQLSTHRLTITGAYEQLTTQIKQWEQSYLLVSPIAGIVTMTKYWQSNQNITGGEVLATVVPEGKKQIIGKITLPAAGAGKVKEGQYVNVKFDNYPYLEFGMVKVPITHISLVPVTSEKETNYILEVAFPDKLVTNYGKELPFGQEMQGSAEIITDDLRLIDRFINPIKAVIKK